MVDYSNLPAAFGLDEKDRERVRNCVHRLRDATNPKNNGPLNSGLEYVEFLLLSPERQREALNNTLTTFNVLAALLMSSILEDALNPVVRDDGNVWTAIVANILIGSVVVICAALVAFSAYLSIIIMSLEDRSLARAGLWIGDTTFYGCATFLSLYLVSVAVILRQWMEYSWQIAVFITILFTGIFFTFFIHFFVIMDNACPVFSQYWSRLFAPFMLRDRNKRHAHAMATAMADELEAAFDRVPDFEPCPGTTTNAAAEVEMDDTSASASEHDTRTDTLVAQALSDASPGRRTDVAMGLVKAGLTAAVLGDAAETGGHGLVWSALSSCGFDLKPGERLQLTTALLKGHLASEGAMQAGRHEGGFEGQFEVGEREREGARVGLYCS